MSWGTCYAGSNNIHFDFPPIMSDGRNFAKWQPGAKINQEIRKENDIKSNWQYRQFLTENSDTKIAFAHMDVNTYESSKFILKLIKPRLHENAIILLRGCHNYPGWSVGEYKALQETFSSKEYRFLAFSKDGTPAVIQFQKNS